VESGPYMESRVLLGTEDGDSGYEVQGESDDGSVEQDDSDGLRERAEDEGPIGGVDSSGVCCEAGGLAAGGRPPLAFGASMSTLQSSLRRPALLHLRHAASPDRRSHRECRFLQRVHWLWDKQWDGSGS
jgi:hypothetical protein